MFSHKSKRTSYLFPPVSIMKWIAHYATICIFFLYVLYKEHNCTNDFIKIPTWRWGFTSLTCFCSLVSLSPQQFTFALLQYLIKYTGQKKQRNKQQRSPQHYRQTWCNQMSLFYYYIWNCFNNINILCLNVFECLTGHLLFFSIFLITFLSLH